MNSQLLTHIRTTDERDNLLTEIESLESHLFQLGNNEGSTTNPGSTSGGVIDRVLKADIRFWVSEIIRKEIPSEFQEVQAYFNKLKEDLKGIKVISLKLAFEPTDISIDKLYNYVNELRKEPVLLDMEYDPVILGGAEVTWEGEHRDFSLRRLFEEEYEAKKPEILKTMYTK